MNKLILILILSISFLINWSCNETQKKVHSFLPTKIFIEYNPIPLSKECQDGQMVRVSIPKPHIFIGPPGTIDTTFQILKISIGKNYSEEFRIDNDFYYVKDGIKKSKSTKFFEFEMPSFKTLGIIEGEVHAKLFFNDKLVDEDTSNFKFLEKGENLSVVKKKDFFVTRGRREPVRDTSFDFRFKEEGTYYDDISYLHKIEKKEKHFEVSVKAIGGSIYKKDKSNKLTLITKIPESNEYKVSVPLGFKLEEGNNNSKKNFALGFEIGTVLKEEDIGRVPGYVYYLDGFGTTEEINFISCTKKISVVDTIFLPRFDGWAPIKE